MKQKDFDHLNDMLDALYTPKITINDKSEDAKLSQYSEDGYFDTNCIGLFICQKILQKYGGVISFQAIPGHGTIFSFWFDARNATVLDYDHERQSSYSQSRSRSYRSKYSDNRSKYSDNRSKYSNNPRGKSKSRSNKKLKQATAPINGPS